MTIRKKMLFLCSASGILVLILDAQTALLGAQRGITLCLRSVAPSLFPFLFLCSVMIHTLWGTSPGFFRRLARITGIPQGAESVLTAAILGGYPAGAQVLADACRENGLARKDAGHLLKFCSNAGPAFLFGVTARQFPSLRMIWALWMILILSSLLTGRICKRDVPSGAVLPVRNISLADILTRNVKTMGSICGWILLFQILTAYLERWFFWYLPKTAQVLLCGLLELSSGCVRLNEIPDPGVRFLVCGFLLSSGGLCVAMQTASVIGDLPLKPYLHGKVMQTLLCVILSWMYLAFGWWMLIAAAALLVLPQRKKEVDFQGQTVYNTDIIAGRNQEHAFS